MPLTISQYWKACEQWKAIMTASLRSFAFELPICKIIKQ